MESSDVLEPVPSAALFSPGDVASVSPISSGTLFTDSFGLSLRLIIRGKMTIAKRAGRKKRVAKGIVYGKPKNCKHLEPPGGSCQSFYIGDCDDGGIDSEDFSLEAAIGTGAATTGQYIGNNLGSHDCCNNYDFSAALGEMLGSCLLFCHWLLALAFLIRMPLSVRTLE